MAVMAVEEGTTVESHFCLLGFRLFITFIFAELPSVWLRVAV